MEIQDGEERLLSSARRRRADDFGMPRVSYPAARKSALDIFSGIAIPALRKKKAAFRLGRVEDPVPHTIKHTANQVAVSLVGAVIFRPVPKVTGTNRVAD
jgi:hypothetical protein